MNAQLTYRVVILGCLGCSIGLFTGLPETRAADRNPALSTAELLVDLARDHGLHCRGKQTAADVLHIKTLLRAARRLDPTELQACVWLYELALRGEQPDEAAEMLVQLSALTPGNTTAFANWLEMGPPEVQTLEQRHGWLNGLLGTQQQAQRLALVNTHLARLAVQQVDAERAREYLDQAAQLWPECPDALLLGLELVTPEAPPAERLAAVLPVLRANPAEVGLAWEVGLLLDECGFADHAFAFYQHALSVHEAVTSGGPLPSAMRLRLSRNALARGEVLEAIRHGRRAALEERGTFEARFYLYWLAERKVPSIDIEEYKALLARPFARIKDPADWPVGIVSQAAWFYCLVDEQPQRALMLAEDAARRATGDVFVTRVLGWAQALNGRNDQARDTLTPIANVDPYAAYRLAKLLLETGDEEAPARLVQKLPYLPAVGRARELLDELGVAAAASQPAEQRFPDVLTVLARFDRRVFEFHKDPTRFLAARIKLEDPSLAPGEPWWAVFSLTNLGDFPITLGPDWMVNPVFLLSFHAEGDRERHYPNLLTVSLDHVRTIPPAETVSVRRTIDLGPVRKFVRRTPQHMQSVSVTAILDARQTPEGLWRPSVAGQSLPPASLVRLPANTDPEAWHARFSALKGESSPARFQAIEVMAELLGEHQRASLKRLSYKPQPIPAKRVRQALCGALDSESWELRARTLDALQTAGLDRTLVDAAQRCLEHSHWLVRMMAVRLLARQGEAFAETAQRIAAEDEDELVRAMARSYVERWAGGRAAQPTTQPDLR